LAHRVCRTRLITGCAEDARSSSDQLAAHLEKKEKEERRRRTTLEPSSFAPTPRVAPLAKKKEKKKEKRGMALSSTGLYALAIHACH